jgi:rod shape-determining protein MreD
MIRTARFTVTLGTAILVQASFFPAWLSAPFIPNLTLFFVVHLGLREPFRWSNCLAAFLIGLIQDCFSGNYFGLHGFIYLCLYLLLKQTSERLYTDNNLLIVIGVFLGILLDGIMTFGLLLLFSAADGIYGSLFSGLIPHALMSAVAALFLVGVTPGLSQGHAR